MSVFEYDQIQTANREAIEQVLVPVGTHEVAKYKLNPQQILIADVQGSPSKFFDPATDVQPYAGTQVESVIEPQVFRSASTRKNAMPYDRAVGVPLVGKSKSHFDKTLSKVSMSLIATEASDYNNMFSGMDNF